MKKDKKNNTNNNDMGTQHNEIPAKTRKDGINMKYEIALSNFLETDVYDHASYALYDAVSAAFKAGWMAANGIMPESDAVKVIKMAKTEQNQDNN